MSYDKHTLFPAVTFTAHPQSHCCNFVATKLRRVENPLRQKIIAQHRRPPTQLWSHQYVRAGMAGSRATNVYDEGVKG